MCRAMPDTDARGYNLPEPTQVEDSELRIQSVPIGSITGFDRNKSDSDKN